MANTILPSQKLLLRVTIVPFDHSHHLLKSFSKTKAHGTWLFWAIFLFRLSVPTMGKPHVWPVWLTTLTPKGFESWLREHAKCGRPNIRDGIIILILPNKKCNNVA
ncbi:MAG TPA: hypothetical protein VGN34_21370 [Ktedonobacteraceae bacterium]|jgi:hypothetical protein